MIKTLLTFALLLFTQLFFAQSYLAEAKISWEENRSKEQRQYNAPPFKGSFEGAFFTTSQKEEPLVFINQPLPSYGDLKTYFIEKETVVIPSHTNLPFTPRALSINTYVELENKNAIGKILFNPIYKDQEGNLRKIIKYRLGIDFTPKKNSNHNQRSNTFNSVLSDGDIYKLSTHQAGIYQLDYNFLKNDLGITPEDLPINNIQLFGNGGGALPETISASRIDDLKEIPIHLSIGGDGRFDEGDYLLFYAESAHPWLYDNNENRFHQKRNPYDDSSHYFLKIGNDSGLRISTKSSVSPMEPNLLVNESTDYLRHEQDKTNLLDQYIYGIGSGRQWFGEWFDAVRSYDFSFDIPNLSETKSIHVKSSMAIRKNGSNTFSRYQMKVNENTFNSNNVRGTNTANIEATYAKVGTAQGEIQVSPNAPINVTIDYDVAGAEAWLDYIEINASRRLSYVQDQMHFRASQQFSSNTATTTFQLSDADANVEIWDISKGLVSQKQDFSLSGNLITFTVNTQAGFINEYIAFDKTRGFLRPQSKGKINNQNLHGIDRADLVIIYHPNFENATKRLQQHRESHSNLIVEIVEIDQIFNEFSSGNLDPTAIRDFLRMLKQRDPSFRYCLLMGDGSFDYKNINQLEENHNYIPVYETLNSFDPIFAFPTDDYYALLSDNEGNSLRGGLDIATGRLPVRSATEAEALVQKIIHYETSPSTLGDWRNNLTFTADDEDSNTHLNQADRIATQVDTSYQNLNLKKIYMDAFEQVSLAGGGSYPAANQAINNAIFKGHLVMNYMGHGGPRGWAQERVLNETDINAWNNIDKLPLFVTATCTFAAYDDPTNVSAGEQLILKGDGGAIGLFTTVRSVFSSSNERLTKATFNTLFEKVDGKHPPIGEILRLAKNANSADTLQPNARKYTLLGDPAMQLALPKYNVQTTAINDVPLTGSDTLKALQRVKIAGIITDENGNIASDFNGKIFPTVFDKYIQARTLGNDASSFPRNFDVQNSILFKGAATVNNGRFEFSFVVPKDINYSFGFGKISYYAHDGSSLDAAGAYEQITIGGTDSNAVTDNEGPIVEVFMNDENFVEGGTTDTDPVLLVKVSDEIGINVAGTSIGHDMTALLDANNQSNYVLNDFYESQLDDFTRGTVKYPLYDLETGEHHIKVTAWDVANNVGFGETNFVVVDNLQQSLEHVLNYPNPFTTKTEFQFEHGLPSNILEVQIQIFSLSGKLVKTIQTEASSNGKRVAGIFWDGLDDFGDPIGRGIYLYKIKINATQINGATLKSESEYEKLVVLR